MKRIGTPDTRQTRDSGKVRIGGGGMNLRKPRPARPHISDNSKADSTDVGKLAPKK